MNKVINVFQYDWNIQIHTINLIQKLSDEGFKVNVFVSNCSEVTNSLEDLISPNITINYYLTASTNYFIKKINTITYWILGCHFFIKKVDQESISMVLEKINTTDINYFIGVEKKGFIWAGKVYDQVGGKLIYYSLELYEKDPEWIEKTEFKYLRKLEVLYHHKAEATIIQDPFRATNLFRYNNYPVNKILYCPVSLKRDNFNINEGKLSNTNKYVMYFGKIAKHRFVEEICGITKKRDNKIKIWLHGPCDSTYLEKLNSKFDNPSLKITNNLLEFREIPSLLKDVSIGICFYRIDNLNERLTAFSSEKIALFLLNGIPIIVFKNESYDYLFEKFKCGIAIRKIEDLDQAVNKILLNYETFSNNSKLAFSEFFNFDYNIKETINFLNED